MGRSGKIYYRCLIGGLGAVMVLDFLFKRIFHGKNFTSRRVSLMKKDFNLSEVVKSAVALFKFYLGIKIIS